MPTTSVTVSDELLSSTLLSILDNKKNQDEYRLGFLEAHREAHGDGGQKYSFGPKIIIPFDSGEHSRTTVLSSGYEPVAMNVDPIGDVGQDSPIDCIRPIVISGHEKRQNQSDRGKIIDILARRTKQMMFGFKREFHRRILGNSLTTPLTDLNTLNGIDESDGVFQNAAVGSQTNTIHGISRGGSYQSVPGMQHQYSTMSGSFSSNGLPGIANMLAAIEGIGGGGNVQIVASVQFAENIRRSLSAREQYVNGEKSGGEKPVLMYRGYKLRPTRDMNSSTTTGAHAISAYVLDFDHIHLLVQEWFRPGAFVSQFPGGYDTSAAPVHLMAQLVAKSFGTSGIIINGDAW